MSNAHLSNGAVRFKVANSDTVDTKQHISLRNVSKRKHCLRHVFSDYNNWPSHRSLIPRKHWSPFYKARRMVYFVPFASADEGVAINGSPQPNPNNDLEEMRAKLNQSLQGEDPSSGLVQSIHDAARAIELAIHEHSSSSRTSWFSKAWLGVDKNAWVKTLSYQVDKMAFQRTLLFASCVFILLLFLL